MPTSAATNQRTDTPKREREPIVKTTVQKAAGLVVLSARIYRELAVSAFSLFRPRP